MAAQHHNSKRARWPLQLLLCAALSMSGGCVSVQSQPRLFVFSDPEGATVYINGEDTGFTTPAQIDPAVGQVSVSKEGYVSQVRKVTSVTYFRYPRWNDGGTPDYTVTLSILRVWRDFLFPFQFYTWESPRRLYFKLERDRKDKTGDGSGE
jgi:hypothetical protein